MKTRDLRQLLLTIAILAVLALFTTSSVFAGGVIFGPGPFLSVSFGTQEEDGTPIANCRATDTSVSDLNDFCRIDKKGNKFCHINDHVVDIEYTDASLPAGTNLFFGTGSLNMQCWGDGCGPGISLPPQKKHMHTILITGEVTIGDDTFRILCHNVWDAKSNRRVGIIELY